MMDEEKRKQIVLETEAAAQKIFITKEEIIALDNRRQKTREAHRALKIKENQNEKAWISMGNLFVKIRTDKAVSLLEKDITELNKEIAKQREQLKNQVKLLRDLEGKPELLGFDLKPLNREIEAITQALLPSSL